MAELARGGKPGPKGNGTLRAVSALGPNDVWAAGDYVAPSTQAQSLIEHYTGSCGSPTATSTPTVAQPTPTCVSGCGGARYAQPAGQRDALRAVSARSGSDVWAVGEYDNGQSTTVHTLLTHWDGSSWQRVPG